MDRDEILRVLHAFEASGLEYVLIGATAMGFHGVVRATEDLDYPPSGDLYFDILTRLGEVASFETVDAETKHIEGTRVQVATPTALYRLKKGTIRAKDHQDAAALRERFNLKDED
jgi:hypothetical protein